MARQNDFRQDGLLNGLAQYYGPSATSNYKQVYWWKGSLWIAESTSTGATLYKDGTSMVSLAMAENVSSLHVVKPVLFHEQYAYFPVCYRDGSDFKPRLKRYDLDSGTTTTVWTQSAIQTMVGTYSDSYGAGDITLDPVSGKIYLALVVSITNSIGATYWGKVIYQCTAAGAVDHRVYVSTGNYTTVGSYTRQDLPFQLSTRDNTVYVGYYTVFYSAGTTYTTTWASCDGTLTDTSLSTIWTTSGASLTNIGATPCLGLHWKSNASATLWNAAESISWDLSSYMDSNHELTLLWELTAGSAYIVLASKTTALSLLRIYTAGAIELLESKTIVRDPTWTSADYRQLLSTALRTVGVYPQRIIHGSAKEVVEAGGLNFGESL